MHHALVHPREASAEERLHDHGGNRALVKELVERLGVDVARVDLLRVVPVHPVELYLHEVPVDLLVHREGVAEHRLVAVEREPQVADAPGLAFLEQEIEHTVVDEAAVEHLHRVLAAAADRMEQVEVDVVGVQEAQGRLVHFPGRLMRPRLGVEVGEFRGDEPLFTGMLRERVAKHLLALATAVGRRRVEVVHSVFDAVVDLALHEGQVDGGVGTAAEVVGVAAVHRGVAHRAIAEQTHPLAVYARASRHPRDGSGCGRRRIRERCEEGTSVHLRFSSWRGMYPSAQASDTKKSPSIAPERRGASATAWKVTAKLPAKIQKVPGG